MFACSEDKIQDLARLFKLEIHNPIPSSSHTLDIIGMFHQGQNSRKLFTLIYSTSNFILSCSDTRNDHAIEGENKEFPANCSLDVSQLSTSGPCRKKAGCRGT